MNVHNGRLNEVIANTRQNHLLQAQSVNLKLTYDKIDRRISVGL